MSDIAKDLFKSIVSDTASAETFSGAMKKKMDQALDVRKAGIAAHVYGNAAEVVEESVEDGLEEAKLSKSDLGKVIKSASKMGKLIKKDTVDFGGAKIKFSIDKGRIKFDGGKSSEVTYFDNTEDAIATLGIVS